MGETFKRTGEYPSTVQEFWGIMKSIQLEHNEIWTASNGERLEFRECRPTKVMPRRLPIPEPGPPVSRTAWSVCIYVPVVDGLIGESKGWAVIEATQRMDYTLVKFFDGRCYPHGKAEPIGSSFQEFAQMIVNEWKPTTTGIDTGDELHRAGSVQSDNGLLDVSKKRLTQLRQILIQRFDEGELRTLCVDLGVDYDVLLGEGKNNKARELVEYLKRRNRIPELVKVGKRQRSDIPWNDMLKETPSALQSVSPEQLREEQRNRVEYRRKRIKSWREAIDSFDFESEHFGDTVWYSEMRPHMKQNKVKGIEVPRTYHVPNEGRGKYAIKHILLDEISRIEREWGLI